MHLVYLLRGEFAGSNMKAYLFKLFLDLEIKVPKLFLANRADVLYFVNLKSAIV